MKRISKTIYLSYENLFKDLIVWGQASPKTVGRDLSRIRLITETRGERSIFIDFPSCAKSLDNALSRGVLDIRKFAILGNKDGLPEFMNSEFAKVFSNDGTLLREPDIGAVQALRQVLLLYKKVKKPCSEENTRGEVKAFFSLDRTLRSGSDSWNTLDFNRSRVSFEDAISIREDNTPDLLGDHGAEYPGELVRLSQRVCDQVVRGFCLYDPDAIVGHHGPGAVADSKRGMDKYVFPTWNQQLERVFPRDLHASANIRIFEYDSWYARGDGGSLRTLPAKLIPVNKTQEKPRLIASEPTANQFIQGGLRRYLIESIRGGFLKNSISLTRQSLSRDLALKASQDDSISTVDLKNASDRLSMWTVERALRKAPNLLAGLAASRSQFIVDGKYTGEVALLRKYAHQGNATIMPIQSIIYSCLSIAAVVWSAPRWKVRSDSDLSRSIKRATKLVRVYGDDIILPTHALPALSSLLELCQLKVNGGKSHYSGRFSESCGMDAFMGTDVTPVYLASTDDEVQPGDVQSCIDISNVCYMAGLLNLGNFVGSQIPQHIFDTLCMSHFPGPSTLLFTYSQGYYAQQWRWNRSLHCDEYRTSVSEDKPSWERRDRWDSLLQYFVEGPAPDSYGITPLWKSGWDRRGRTRLVRRWVPALR